MRKIPKDIIKDVNNITNEIILYKNENNLSWNKSYKDILEKLNMKEKIEDPRLLSNVITQITKLGYLIEDNPFKLIKYN